MCLAGAIFVTAASEQKQLARTRVAAWKRGLLVFRIGVSMMSVECSAAEFLPHTTEPAGSPKLLLPDIARHQGVVLAWLLITERKRREKRLI